MKRVGVLLGLLLMVCLSLGVEAVSLCDYHSPVTALTDAGLSLAYRYFDDGATPGVDVNGGRVGVDYDQLFDSADFGFSLAGTAEITLDQFVPTGWLGQGAGTFRFYVVPDSSFFAFGGAEGAISPGLVGLEVRAGMGYGRFTDVTPLAKAVEIEEALAKQQAIKENLTSDVLMAIATEIGKEAEYATIKDLVGKIETLIEGVSGISLDAHALLTIEEIVLMAGDDRKCGWAVQAGIGYELIDPFGGARDIVIACSGDAAFASTPKDQLVVHASFSGPFDIVNENTMTASVTYEYEMSQDTLLTADYALQRAKQAGAAASISHAASIGLGFNIGGADVGLQISLTKDAADPAWSIGVSINAAMQLL